MLSKTASKPAQRIQITRCGPQPVPSRLIGQRSPTGDPGRDQATTSGNNRPLGTPAGTEAAGKSILFARSERTSRR